MPIIAGVDFGHTDPRITFPIGGTARISALDGDPSIEIVRQ
jgi:muramoyltetrapeptide carboxypeptidase LdcA involved in peptidoglycan recycling